MISHIYAFNVILDSPAKYKLNDSGLKVPSGVYVSRWKEFLLSEGRAVLVA